MGESNGALENFNTVLGYTNTEGTALSWPDPGQLLLDGDAAFNIMGDWQEGFFRDVGMTPGTDSVWSAVPGTEGIFQFLSDSFVLAKNAPDRDAAIAWLAVAGSIEGQDAFNPIKGSIPARIDADRSLYGQYSLSAMDDWASNTVVGSLAHGVVANDSWRSDINDAILRYLVDGDVAGLQSALVAAAAANS